MLAAGRSRRFKRGNKLVSTIRGAALLAHVLRAVVASRARPVIVVSGHQRPRLKRLIARIRCTGRRVPRIREVFNRHYRTGMSNSLRAGLAVVPPSCRGAIVCLADMPQVSAGTVNALIQAFEAHDSAVIPVSGGRRGNPVLIARRLFPDVSELTGDQGARRVLASAADVRTIAAPSEVLRDVDTVESLARLRRASRIRI